MIAAGILLLVLPIVLEQVEQTQLDTIREQNQLRVVTRLSPRTYYVEANQPGGFELELSQAFADFLGVELQISTANSIQEIAEQLRLNNAHFAAAGLGITSQRQSQFDFSPPYHHSETLLIYRHGSDQKIPKALDQVDEEILVMADSNHAEQLRQLDEAPPWREADSGTEALALLEAVNNSSIRYTLADAEAFETSRPFFPRLRSAFKLDQPQPVAWMLKRTADTSLLQALTQFFALPETQDLIQNLKERHFEYDQRFNIVDSLTFIHHLKERYPKLQPWFNEAAQQQEIDPLLLAAIGYQESHWNPRAISPTGVRGVMMLTQPTARAMGVKKRTDAKQSIFGGAKYFKKQIEQIPERIAEPDRTWFALAAYNVGRGHLEDARVLTQRAGGNQDSWEAVAQHLPKLSQARWYNTVKHGYARGHEPVRYVGNIQRYLQMLKLDQRYQGMQDAQQQSDFIGPPEPPALRQLPSTL
jgi:membrane-bound lytic murein transglycosylase F